MPLPKLHLTPSRDGYAFADAAGRVFAAKVGAGPSFQRLDMIGGPSEVNVQFRLSQVQYAYWRAFYRTEISYGSVPFLLDLLLDFPSLTEHEVKIVPDSYRFTGVAGNRHVIEMTLEAKMAEADAEYDAALVMLFEEYGDDGDDVLRELAILVNESFTA